MWGTNQTVLVVDDDPGCRELHRHWLEDDYVVETAASGDAALQQVSAETDLVLLDREMPGLTGSETLRRLRDRGYDGYVVLVTGVRPDFELADMPVDDYLVKPISDAELTTVVERLQSRTEYHDQLRELFSLAARKGRLEAEKEQTELAASEEYTRLQERLAEKEAIVTASIGEADEQLQAALEACLADQKPDFGQV